MFGESYKDHYITSSAVYSEHTRTWTAIVTIYSLVTIGITPTILTGAEGFYKTESEAEKAAVLIGRDWVIRSVLQEL
jgi:hypothetical protein